MLGRTNTGGGNPLNFKVVEGVMPFGYIDCRNFTADIGKVSVSNVTQKRITVTADGADYRCASYDFDVLPGQVLTFSAEVESGYTGYPRLGLRKYEGGSLVATLVNSDTSITDGKLTLTQMVPAGVTKMRLELFCSWSSAGSGSVTYKNVMMGSSTENAKENMVWVNTDQKITGWQFAADNPNLIDFNTWANGIAYANGTKTISNGSITLTATANNCFTHCSTAHPLSHIACIPGKTYVFEWDCSGAAGNVHLWPNAIESGGIVVSNKVGRIEYTAAENVTKLSFRVGVEKSGTTTTYSNLRITEKDRAFNPGHIWFSTADASQVAFNALKKNGIQVYPTVARQYADGKWNNMYASIYRDNRWVQFSSVFSATISITYPAGSTCTCSDGKTTLRAPNTSGTWKCIVPNTGSWTVKITDGSRNASTNVSITADGQSKSITLSYFAATISITYPAGSTCTCSDGKTTLRAPNTSGTWKCIVPNTGSWKVSCSDGKDTTQKVVQITADGQSKNIELSYRFIVVENGVEIIPATMYGTVASNVSKTQNNGYVTYKSTNSGNYSATVECDVTDYDYLVIKGTCAVQATFSVIGIWTVGTSSPSNINAVAKIDTTATGATLDISSYSGKYKVGIGWQIAKTYDITDWYLE